MWVWCNITPQTGKLYTIYYIYMLYIKHTSCLPNCVALTLFCSKPPTRADPGAIKQGAKPEVSRVAPRGSTASALSSAWTRCTCMPSLGVKTWFCLLWGATLSNHGDLSTVRRCRHPTQECTQEAPHSLYAERLGCTVTLATRMEGHGGSGWVPCCAELHPA